MKAIHIRTESSVDEYELAFVEMFIRLIDGVQDVASVCTMHLISVLYDETVADIAKILDSIRSVGIAAYLYRPPTSQRALPAAGA